MNAADASIVVDNSLDKEPGALVTFSTIMTQLAINVNSDMPEPPVLLFTSVVDPFGAGLAEASCLKPAHVTGTQSAQNFDLVLDALQTQDPDLATVGVVFASGDSNSENSARKAAAAAEARDIVVESAGVIAVSDLAFATVGLVNKGVDAIILVSSNVLAPGTGIVVEAATDAGLPVSSPNMATIYLGATIGVGNYRVAEEGYSVARVLIGWVNGEVDISTTGIGFISDAAVGLNLNSADLAEIAISEELVASADAMVDGDLYRMSPRMVRDAIPDFAELSDEMILMVIQAADIPGLDVVDGKIVMPLATIIGESTSFSASSYTADPEGDAAYLESLQCSDEMIARQQAELESA